MRHLLVLSIVQKKDTPDDVDTIFQAPFHYFQHCLWLVSGQKGKGHGLHSRVHQEDDRQRVRRDDDRQRVHQDDDRQECIRMMTDRGCIWMMTEEKAD